MVMRKGRAIKPKQNSEAARERVLRLMRRKDYVPRRKNEIVDRLMNKGTSRAELEEAIDDLLRQGSIVQIKRDRLVIPQDADLVSGRIVFRQSGSAILIQDAPPGQLPPAPISIRAEDTDVAMHNDRVVVRIERPGRRSGRRYAPDSDQRYGRVIRILERARTIITGCLQKTRLFYYVVPDDPRIVPDIYVPPPAKSGLKPAPQVGDKVVVKLHEWKQRHVNPEGEIIEVLGKHQEPHAELKAIFRKFNLDQEFPEAVEREIEAIPDRVRKSDFRNRQDLRKVFTVTIDPDDAKDFDDALTLEELPNGDVRVGVHIADVGTYVQPGTALDVEAKKRGNSTYLVGVVIPMLPKKLSNGICSLVEREDRLTKTVFLIFSKNGRIKETAFANSVIRSDKRLTYRQAYALLKEDSLKKIRAVPLPPAHQTGSTGKALDSLTDEELRQLQTQVRGLWRIASRVRKRRMEAGSLELEVPEVKIFVDRAGYAERIETIEYDESHQLIEEFMLLANEAVATVLTRSRIPALYRIHEKPIEEKLNEYREYLASFGIHVGDLTQRKEIQKTLRLIKDHPQAYSLRVQFLRSLQRARYAAQPLGHYGLNKKNYTHFTSPIRRYSDLVVHRLFEAYLERFLGKAGPTGKPRHYSQKQLDSLGDHLTITEQNSTEAEREHVKIKLLEFFERDLKKKERSQFEAVITDIRNHGMFIELTGSQAYGFIHISTLSDDLYILTSDGSSLRGRHTKKRYEIGQFIQVMVDRVDRFKRQIDFRLAK